MFEKVYVVNLEVRPDRFEKFISRIPEDWPFPPPTRFEAVDLRSTQAQPEWFKQGDAAWGCASSHRQILERCISQRLESVLILEDDAVFCEDFTAKANAYLKNLPSDWQWAYFGGNNLKNPVEEVAPDVWRAINVNGTFGYAIRGQDAIKKIYQHLCACDWEARHHVDHRYGVLHKSQALQTFVPRHWLVGHSAGKSNITGKENEHDWWFKWNPIASAPPIPMVAVVGPFRGGTSCTAGVLNNLGIYMGAKFKPANKANPKGFFEAQALAQICRQSFKEPWMRERVRKDRRTEQLKQWGDNRKREANAKKIVMAGGKHPTLCLMVEELVEAWGPMTKFVAVNRPLADVKASLDKLRWGWCSRAKAGIPPMMRMKRDKALESIDPNNVIQLEFKELLADPDEQIHRLADLLGISPTQEQFDAAIDFVGL